MPPQNGPVIATVAIPAEDFALGSAITTTGGHRLWLERVVPLGDAFVPYIWASKGSRDAIEPALREEADVESYAVVDETNGEILIRIEWATRVDGFLGAIVESGATVLGGIGESDTWRFRLRFDDRQDLAAYYRRCTDRGVHVTVERVHGETPPDVGVASTLTETQRETLAVALDEGYFDVPRRITLVELADEIGVSDTAVSQCLRRGIESLLRTLPFEDGVPDSAEE